MLEVEQYTMYRLAENLLSNYHYELIYFNRQDNEVWLKKSSSGKTNVIRLLHRTFDWKNHLKIDIASLFQRLKGIRGYFKGKNIEIYNVYIGKYEPIDNWEELKKPLKLKEKNSPKMNVFYLSENSFPDERERLFEKLAITDNSSIDLPVEDEQHAIAENIKANLQKNLIEKHKQMRQMFTGGKPHWTYIFIVINIIMFFLLELNGGSTNIETLIQYGAKYNQAIQDGEWWRIFSSMFLHIGLLHVSMNMLALFYLGSVVERIYHSNRFILIYFLAGIGGGITSFAFNEHIAAGASGAIFGLFGALLYFGTIQKQLFIEVMGKNLLIILVINIGLGFMIPQIDMGAHIGGLIAGYIASAMVHFPKKRKLKTQIFGFVVYFALITITFYYGLS